MVYVSILSIVDLMRNIVSSPVNNVLGDSLNLYFTVYDGHLFDILLSHVATGLFKSFLCTV